MENAPFTGQLPETPAVLRTLRGQRIRFYGPLRTPRGHCVLYLQGQIYLESELVDLLKYGALDNQGLAKLARGIAGRHREC
jgi:hypothetical protein